MEARTKFLDWEGEQRCRQVAAAMNKRGFHACFCPSREDALAYIRKEAADAQTVAMGESMSVRQIGVPDMLLAEGKTLLRHGLPELSPEERLAICRQQLTADISLTGSNAVTMDGRLLNIDGMGNRVASMFFGPPKSLIVIGRNKITEDMPAAYARIKNYSAPMNARRLGKNTPCAKTGRCADCSSPDRICAITVALEWAPMRTEIHVLLLNEDLGL